MMNATELKLLEATAEAAECCTTIVTLSLEVLQTLPIPDDAKAKGRDVIAELKAKMTTLEAALTAFKAHRQAVERLSGGRPA